VEVSHDSLSSQLNPVSNKAIEFLGALSFDQILTETKSGKNVEDKYVKVSDHLYKVQRDDSVSAFDSTPDPKKELPKVESLSYDKIETDEHELSKKIDEPKQQNPQPHHQGYALNLLILNKDAFLSKLPESLRSFIKETVDVVKIQKGLFDDTSYKFSFKELNLNVLIEERDQKIVIRIELTKADIKEKLFTEENNKLLLQALKKELSEDNIELEFVYTESESNSPSDQESTNQSSEEADEEPTEDFQIEG